MSIRKRLVGFVVWAVASAMLAQTTETKQPDSGYNGANSLSSAIVKARRNGGKGRDEAEILTDTMGVDFAPYLTQAQTHRAQEMAGADAAVGVSASLETRQGLD
jgi:hypothetical protein